MSHWSEKYIGKEWKEDYDCYAFFKDVQKNEFGLSDQLDFQPPCYKSRAEALSFVHNSEVIQTHWKVVDYPTEGDAILFGSYNNTFHIGVWVIISGSSGVLHNRRGHGVVFTPRTHIIASSIKIAEYLRSIK